MKKKYAIIDIETTGGRASQEKITEIAIVLHDGEKILDTYETLINPERAIPYHITSLTGITQAMVEDAPKFYEVAKEIVRMTDGAIFVAHNVRFDYSFIKEEFKSLGYTFSKRQLCTVRLSRKAFPGLRSYSLGNLIKHFKIKVNDRHRAMADTMATVELFEKILEQERSLVDIDDLINMSVKESLLPKNLTINRLHALPEECGVYFFHNKKGRVVYVGKSKNIQKRVMQHFTKVTDKASKLQKQVYDISYELMGSELIALLYESHLIKQLNPSINRAQRQKYFPILVYHYKDEKGYICFDVAKNVAANRAKLNVISEYPTAIRAKSAIKYVRHEFELCAYYCNLEVSKQPCFNYHIKKCFGACIEEEAVEVYNDRAHEAIKELSTIFKKDFIILDEGRNKEEHAVVLVEGGEYKGFGYIEKEFLDNDLEILRDAITPYRSYPESTRIIQRFLAGKHRAKIIEF